MYLQAENDVGFLVMQLQRDVTNAKKNSLVLEIKTMVDSNAHFGFQETI